MDLGKKEQKSLSIISKALRLYKKERTAIGWTGGKDSTVLLHLVRRHFGNKLPVKVLFNDSTMEFDEIYEFIKMLKKEWNFPIIVQKHSKRGLERFAKEKRADKKKELSRILKIEAIEVAVTKYELDSLMAGIRWDEHDSRSYETFFSPRQNHMRVHPILHFTEKDVWSYINKYNIPYVNLYDKGYRSLGEKPFTSKSTKKGGERSGRERDKEKLMEKLRKLGYW